MIYNSTNYGGDDHGDSGLFDRVEIGSSSGHGDIVWNENALKSQSDGCHCLLLIGSGPFEIQWR